jgi:hypothetical protein
MSVFTHVIFHRFYRFDTIFQVSKYDVGRVMYRAFRTHLYHSSHTDGNYCTSPYRGFKFASMTTPLLSTNSIKTSCPLSSNVIFVTFIILSFSIETYYTEIIPERSQPFFLYRTAVLSVLWKYGHPLLAVELVAFLAHLVA